MRGVLQIVALVLGLLPLVVRGQGPASGDFFDPAVLHEIRIVMQPGDWQALHSPAVGKEYFRCSFEWRGVVVGDAGVRTRGNSTRDPVKPGLHVDFNRYVDSQTFLGLKSVELKNSVQDASMLRDRLSMLLARRMGLAAPRAVHAKVFVNGEYGGVYEVVESIDKTFLKRQFGENDGYLYEYEWTEPYGFEYRGQDPALYSPAPFQPQTNESKPDAAPIEAMIRMINFAPDEEFPAAMQPFLDLPRFLKHIAWENYLGDTDGIVGDSGLANFFLYRFEDKQLSQFIAWDKDNTFREVQSPILRNAAANVLARRALENPSLRRSFFESMLLAAGMAGGPGGWLEQEIDKAYVQIRDAVYEDPVKRCPVEPFTPAEACTNERFEAEVELLRVYARKRPGLVRQQIAEAGYTYGPEAMEMAGSSLTGAVPGSLAVLSGAFPGVAGTQAGDPPLPEILAGASVLINGFPAPLFFVSSTNFVVQIPWEVSPGNASVVAVFNGQPGPPVSVEIEHSAPAVLAVTHSGGSQPIAGNPAAPGQVLWVYAAGLGPVGGKVATGAASPSEELALTTAAPSAKIGEVEATVEFSGLAPGMVGLYQLNVRVPLAAPVGERIGLVLHVSGVSSPPFAVAIGTP